MPTATHKGKVIAIEGINGTGPLVVDLIEWLKENLKYRVMEIQSVDAGRLASMGAEGVPGLPFGISKELDIYYELTARAINCEKNIRPALNRGMAVLCKNFIIASKVNYKMNHAKFLRQLETMEKMSRGFNFRTRIKPDLTIFLNPDPVTCYERLVGVKPIHSAGYYLRMQELYLEEVKKVDNLIVDIREDDAPYFQRVKNAIEAL